MKNNVQKRFSMFCLINDLKSFPVGIQIIKNVIFTLIIQLKYLNARCLNIFSSPTVRYYSNLSFEFSYYCIRIRLRHWRLLIEDDKAESTVVGQRQCLEGRRYAILIMTNKKKHLSFSVHLGPAIFFAFFPTELISDDRCRVGNQ